jgi:alpha-L-rhamnosidase
MIVVDATVPTGTTAQVDLPSTPAFQVGSGIHTWTIAAPEGRDTKVHLDWLTTPLSEIIDDEPAYDAIRNTLTAIDPQLSRQKQKEILWTRGFTLDEVFRGLPPGARQKLDATLEALNDRP